MTLTKYIDSSHILSNVEWLPSVLPTNISWQHFWLFFDASNTWTERATRLEIRSYRFIFEIPRCKRPPFSNSFFHRTWHLWHTLPNDTFNLLKYKCNVNFLSCYCLFFIPPYNTLSISSFLSCNPLLPSGFISLLAVKLLNQKQKKKW